MTRTTLAQLETPDEMCGRVGAVNSIFIGTSNQLGEFESGATAALLGPVAPVVLGGVGTLLVAALWLRIFPALAQRDRMIRKWRRLCKQAADLLAAGFAQRRFLPCGKSDNPAGIPCNDLPIAASRSCH